MAQIAELFGRLGVSISARSLYRYMRGLLSGPNTMDATAQATVALPVNKKRRQLSANDSPISRSRAPRMAPKAATLHAPNDNTPLVELAAPDAPIKGASTSEDAKGSHESQWRSPQSPRATNGIADNAGLQGSAHEPSAFSLKEEDSSLAQTTTAEDDAPQVPLSPKTGSFKIPAPIPYDEL